MPETQPASHHPRPNLPRRAPKLEIHEIEDGYVVYGDKKDKAHYLSPMAAAIFELCTGELTLEEIGELVKAAFGSPPSADDEIASCIAALRREGLVT